MPRLKCLFAILLGFSMFAVCAAAQANSFHLTVITPGMMQEPVERVPGHWECVRYNQWNGDCKQLAWMPPHWIQPVAYGPYYGPVYYGPHFHHHRYYY